jgi:putative colanic acid biosynthesis acetyltransferase WcaF
MELQMISPVQDLKSFRLPPNFRGRPAWFVQLWWLVEASLFRFSPQIMYGWRRWLLRLFGAKIGKGVNIRPTTTITYPWKVSIGDWSQIGDGVVLYSLGDIEIGQNVVISQRSYVCTGSHDYNVPAFDIWAKKITVEPEVWVGTDVFIAPGVRIGRGAVVGARSSVFRDLNPMQVYIGNPAKPIKSRKSETSACD